MGVDLVEAIAKRTRRKQDGGERMGEEGKDMSPDCHVCLGPRTAGNTTFLWVLPVTTAAFCFSNFVLF